MHNALFDRGANDIGRCVTRSPRGRVAGAAVVDAGDRLRLDRGRQRRRLDVLDRVIDRLHREHGADDGDAERGADLSNGRVRATGHA